MSDLDLRIAFDNTFVRDLEGLYEPWQAAPASSPRLLQLNRPLAVELGFDPDELESAEGVDVLVGNTVPEGATPVAQAYAGHQFGGYSPRLGDGRALLVGELVDVHGRRRDLHLKGSGRTPFARGGDGRAAVGPMLREYVVSEAMHALGIPTTRSLAVVATGDTVVRETALPGAVLARVAASHLRVGSFEYAARHDPDLVRRLADHAIARHHPQAAETANPALALLDEVVEAQAALVARWMLVGFIHGVMNTDNMTISGETIDYGPCAFMDAYDPGTVYSSIDHGGRYSYGNQPVIAQWNLARLAETLLPLIADDPDTSIALATAVLESFTERYQRHWLTGMRAKLGLAGADGDSLDDNSLNETDRALVDDLLTSMQAQRVDWTSCFRSLSAAARGDAGPARSLFAEPQGFDDWLDRWTTRLTTGSEDREGVARAMDRANPIYVPRNHLVEEALTAATDGDLGPFRELTEVLAEPFVERPGLDRYARPAPDEFGPYRTFCGT